jgi:streptogramin lyase
MMTNQMYVLQPATGTWRQVPIPAERSTPRAIEIDRQGRWWVVLGAAGRLGRFDGERWQTYELGLYAHSVALDSIGGAYANGHFTRDPELIIGVDSSGAVRRYPLPSHATLARRPGGPIPYEIRTAPDGTLWMSELQGDRLIQLDPLSGHTSAVTLPQASRGPRRFDIDPAGILWIPAYASGELLRYDPARRRFDTVALPIRDALPYVVRVDAARGVVWIGTGAADAVLAYYPASRRFDVVQLPTAGALVRHLAIDPRTGALWVAYGAAPSKSAARIARITAAPID